MSCQKGALALSFHVKARIHMVYIGFQQSTRDSIRHTTYSSRNNCLWSCHAVQLLIWPLQMQPTRRYHQHRNHCENTEGNTYLQERTHLSIISLHSMGFPCYTFPITAEEDSRLYHRKADNCWPFYLHQTFPNRPHPSHFAKLPKVTSKRKRPIKAFPSMTRKNYVPNKKATFHPKPKNIPFATPAMVAATPNLPTTPNPPVEL